MDADKKGDPAEARAFYDFLDTAREYLEGYYGKLGSWRDWTMEELANFIRGTYLNFKTDKGGRLIAVLESMQSSSLPSQT